jgi:pyruvate-formate lyase
MREFFDNVCANNGWSMAIGGTRADGGAAYQELTEICLEASHHRHRPSLELRVRDDMPDQIWDLTMEALSTGCGQPAFYNERGYLGALRLANLGIRDEDIVKWNGGAGRAGRDVGASPDGRRAGQPLADSAGPVQGRDKNGPTAMLKSVTRLPQQLEVGTPVLNMRVSRTALAKPERRRHVRPL